MAHATWNTNNFIDVFIYIFVVDPQFDYIQFQLLFPFEFSFQLDSEESDHMTIHNSAPLYSHPKKNHIECLRHLVIIHSHFNQISHVLYYLLEIKQTMQFDVCVCVVLLMLSKLKHQLIIDEFYWVECDLDLFTFLRMYKSN